MTRKAYKDFTEAEKAEYKAKRDAWQAKKDSVLKDSFEKLEGEIIALSNGEMSKKIKELLTLCKNGVGIRVNGSAPSYTNREGYLTAIFETETPEVGQTTTSLRVGVRGSNGERMLENETMKQFASRVDDIVYKHDVTSISQMIWYLKRRGHIVDFNKTTTEITYIGFQKEEKDTSKIIDL